MRYEWPLCGATRATRIGNCNNQNPLKPWIPILRLSHHDNAIPHRQNPLEPRPNLSSSFPTRRSNRSWLSLFFTSSRLRRRYHWRIHLPRWPCSQNWPPYHHWSYPSSILRFRNCLQLCTHRFFWLEGWHQWPPRHLGILLIFLAKIKIS